MSTTQTEDTRNPTSGTGQGLIDFLGYVIDNHYMNNDTASSLRTGVKRVLDADTDLSFDIRDADIDDILNRFHNRVRGKLKDRSVEVYASRFRTSIEMYDKWLNKDKDWLPAPLRTRKPASNNGPARSQATPATSVSEPDTTELAPASGVITYPFPIRAGLQGRITLPENLTRREADRISAFIKTLAIEEEPVYEHSPQAISGVVMDDE